MAREIRYADSDGVQIAYEVFGSGPRDLVVEVRGDDIGGLAVHIAARVAALAESGEVLTWSTVRDLVSGSGIEFTSRGSHALKGVPGQWELYAA